MRYRILAVGLAVGLAVTGVAATAFARPSTQARSHGTELSLVAYTTPREAYAKRIPMFQTTPQGDGVNFKQSYGASGGQARAVKAGLRADIVALSLAPDVDTLVPDLVDPKWKKQSYKGMVTNSVVVFVVRKGNPKGIKTWDDLVKPDVEVITPNPFTSGGARWNLMAAYGAQLELGKTEDQALDYLHQLLSNTPVQDKSAREALQTFVGGKGDVMIAYENGAITVQQKGEDVDYVIPDQRNPYGNPNPGRSVIHPVSDLMLEFQAETPTGGGELTIELLKGSDRFHARFDLASGECKLIRKPAAGPEVLGGGGSATRSTGGGRPLRGRNCFGGARGRASRSPLRSIPAARHAVLGALQSRPPDRLPPGPATLPLVRPPTVPLAVCNTGFKRLPGPPRSPPTAATVLPTPVTS